MPLPVRRPLQTNTTIYTNYDPEIAKLVRQMQNGLKLGHKGPLSVVKKRRAKTKPVQKSKTTPKNRISPTLWYSIINGIPVGENFAVKHPNTKRLMPEAEYRRSGLSNGRSVSQLTKRFEQVNNKQVNKVKKNKQVVNKAHGRGVSELRKLFSKN